MTKFAPGFRLSVLDVLVLLAGGWGTWFLGRKIWWAGAIVGFVVGHFFLFCNVFRIARKAELVWAAVFVLLCGATIATEFPGWMTTFGISLLLTVVLVVREMKQPHYHGIFWQRVNPNLLAWWETGKGRNPVGVE
jgi:hypothetical protein